MSTKILTLSDRKISSEIKLATYVSCFLPIVTKGLVIQKIIIGISKEKTKNLYVVETL